MRGFLGTRCTKMSATSWQQVIVIEFWKWHDTTDTMDCCAHQLVTDFLRGNWCNGFWLYACITGPAVHKQENHPCYKVSITSVFFNHLFIEAQPLAAIFTAQSLSWGHSWGLNGQNLRPKAKSGEGARCPLTKNPFPAPQGRGSWRGGSEPLLEQLGIGAKGQGRLTEKNNSQ